MDSRNQEVKGDKSNQRHRSRSNRGHRSNNRDKQRQNGRDPSREASPARNYIGLSAYSFQKFEGQRDKFDGQKKSYAYGGHANDFSQSFQQHEPIKKDFYVEHETTKERSEEENQRFMQEHQIQTTGEQVPRPVQQFDESNLPKYLVDQLKGTPKFQAPTPIQCQSWPVALSGRDVIGIAQTGSGKTLAFTIPAIVHVMAQPVLKRGDGPIVLVMAPTRELVMQIEMETRNYANVCQLTSLAVYGGAPRIDQQRKLRGGVEILIATPGRLLDFVESRDTNLRRITYLVLDEADRMLDMGFEKDIRKILGHITHPDRQTTMFSATWPVEIQSLAQTFCTMAPIQIRIGNTSEFDGGLTLNKDIAQNIHVLDSNYEKYGTLIDLLMKQMENEQQHKIIIFCQTKAGVDDLERSLRNDAKLNERVKFEVRGIHGDKQQRERDYTLNMFKRQLEGFTARDYMRNDVLKSNLLVATDVASRGLDVKDISIVINYDMPTCIEDYVHRIGRTGRAGKKGISHSFITKKELGLVNDLIKILKRTDQFVAPELYDLKRISINAKQENKFRKWRKPGETQPFHRGGGPPRFSRGGHDDDRYQRGPRDFNNKPSYPDRFQNQRGHGYQPQQSSNQFGDRREDYKSSRNQDDGGRQRDYADNQSYLNDISKQRFTQQDLKNELFGSSHGGMAASGPPANGSGPMNQAQ